MKRILTLIITATFSLCSIVSSEEETTDSNPTPTLPKSDEGKPEGEAKSPDLINPSININADLLQTAPRLSKEARRQDNVGRRARNIAKNMNLLFLDLQSNGLLEEGNGDQLKQTGNLLLTVARKDVPGVADKLRQAQANINEALPHIKGAEEEIGKVISDLDKVIEGAKSILVDDRLLRELTEIIKQEELLKKGSIDWIRKMQVNPDSKNVDRGRLSIVQESVIDQYAEFYDLLIQSKEAS